MLRVPPRFSTFLYASVGVDCLLSGSSTEQFPGSRNRPGGLRDEWGMGLGFHHPAEVTCHSRERGPFCS